MFPNFLHQLSNQVLISRLANLNLVLMNQILQQLSQQQKYKENFLFFSRTQFEISAPQSPSLANSDFNDQDLQYHVANDQKLERFQKQPTGSFIQQENQSHNSPCSILEINNQAQNNECVVQDRQIKPDKRYLAETKNILKNYGKNIINFILTNSDMKLKLLKSRGIDLKKFNQITRYYKTKIITISGMRSFWSDDNNKYAQLFRILSLQYMRKHCLKDFLGSKRINNLSLNLKYRYKIMKALKNPNEFTFLKGL